MLEGMILPRFFVDLKPTFFHKKIYQINHQDEIFWCYPYPQLGDRIATPCSNLLFVS